MKPVMGLIVGALAGAMISYVVISRSASPTPVITTNGTMPPNGTPPPGPLDGSACVTGKNRKTAVIEVFDDPDPVNAGKCKAKVSPGCVGNKRTNMNVFWMASYDEDSQTCAASSGNWQVELRFEADPNDGGNPIPYNGEQNIKINHNGNRFKYKLKNNYNTGTFPYTVWFIPGSGAPYPMADPELEIEM